MDGFLIQLLTAAASFGFGYVIALCRYREEADDLRDELEAMRWNQRQAGYRK